MALVYEKKPPIRKITRRAFWQRVTDVKYAELIEISQANYLLKARIDILNGASHVDLDDESVVSAFAELVAAGVFTTQDEERIFADGREDEKPDF